MFARTYEYTLSWTKPNLHTYTVEILTESSDDSYTDFLIPAWRPGRYILQNFAAAISEFEAFDNQNQKLSWQKQNKDTWRVFHKSKQKIKVKYKFYANIQDAGSSFLGNTMAYINPSNLFMYIKGDLNSPCTLEVKMPDDWKAATSLTPLGNKKWSAESYHLFIDSPSIFSPTLKTISFKVDNVDIYCHFQGKYSANQEDEKALVENITKIIREQKAIFGELPLKYYHFIYLLLPFNIRHAVEHEYCSMFALPEYIANQGDKFEGLLSITSHEFWHLWNVKRIRPAALWPYQYATEAYTTLHWFTEGITSYYTDLTLLRCGLTSPQQYFKDLARLFEDLDNNYASRIVSCAASSFDSWLATSNYNHPNHQISFYSQGHRIGFLLDMELRKVSNGKISLDDVFKDLYENCYKKNKGVEENGVQKSCEKLTGKSFQDFFDKYVYGTEPIPYNDILKPFEITIRTKPYSPDSYTCLGITRIDKSSGRVQIAGLVPDSDAAIAGLGIKDFILEIDGKEVTTSNFESFFREMAINQKLKFTVISEGIKTEYTVTFTGNSVPKMYEMAVPKNNKLLNDYMKSKAGY
ncbi:MAG: peptidase M61 [Bacteroidia bacterium]|nr:MAG: peptidase M61 [Bacteroidia bacterium]